MLTPIRKIIKIFHPEAIPFPGTVFYNVISSTAIFQRHYELIAQDVLNYCTEGHLLDIGTGPGWLLKKLHESSSKLQITGVDISPSMVEKARKNIKNVGLSDVINIKEGGSEDLPFTDDSFDIVVSSGSIHHWKDPTRGLNEVYRILKSGGYALMYDLASDILTSCGVLRGTARDPAGQER